MNARFKPNEIQFLPAIGGCDFVTPILDQPPGRLRLAKNMEIDVNGGYQSARGYEVYDGRTSPSAATYVYVLCTFSAAIAIADTVTGSVSGATGYVIGVESGAVAVTAVTGTFQDAENLIVSALVKAAIIDDPHVNAASTPKLDRKYLNLAADQYRADIGAVPGSGRVFGVCRHNNVLYAWRNNDDGSAARIYKSSAAGWVLVALGRELSFTGASKVAATGTVTLTGGGSGSVDGITVDSVAIMSGAESFDTNLATTATAVAANITANTSNPNYTAAAVGAVITITAVIAGAGSNTFAVVSSATTITTTDVNLANGYDGFAEGNTITGATSSATAVITRVVIEAGTIEGGDASGRLIFASQTGTFQAENLDVGNSVDAGTISGNSSAIVLQPSGRVKTVQSNLSGAAGTRRIYGCDGVNRGFEFDGTVYVPISTGMATDAPENIVVFKFHLFFSFGASIQFSSPGNAHVWLPVLGASEIALGDNVTGFSVQRGSATGGALAIFSRNSTNILYGNVKADFNLVPQKLEVGGFANSVQDIGFTIIYDDSGIIDLRTAQEFGNFQSSILSKLVNTFVQERKLSITDSCVVRNKNQYRVFFDDNTALYVTVEGGEVLGMIPQLLEDKVECITSVESDNGDEIFFGSDDGYCYQMERGTSFNGETIDYFGFFEYWHCKSPGMKKRFKSAVAEITGETYAEYGIGFELGYGAKKHPQPDYKIGDFNTNFGNSRWDSFVFGDFWWDADSVVPRRVRLHGNAENIGFIIAGSSDEYGPIRISGLRIRFKFARIIR